MTTFRHPSRAQLDALEHSARQARAEETALRFHGAVSSLVRSALRLASLTRPKGVRHA